MTCVLGVDGGNSKTIAVVGNRSGEILGVTRTGSGSHQAIGLQSAMENIRAAIDGALAQARLGRANVQAAFYALAGADLPEDFDLLRPALHELGYGKRIQLDNDAAASLRSGSDNPNAVVVGWGSGSNGMGRNAKGQQIRLPSLGTISGDWGGGDDLAREAIWLVARAHDGRGRPTALTNLVLEALDAPNVDEMIRRLYLRQVDRDYLRCLPPLVFQAADAGDQVAVDLLERAAEEVAITATALLRRLGLIEVAADVVLGGSVFRAKTMLLIDAITNRLRRSAPMAQLALPDVEPVVGAYFCALDMSGVPVDPSVRGRARTSYHAVAGDAARKVRSE